MAFESLSEKIGHIFAKLKNKGALDALEIKNAMREVRIALLEADVNLKVAKDFINKVSEKALGEEILKSLSPTQQVIKIVNEELVELLGSKQSALTFSSEMPTVYMLCGLQGAGKTTMCGKLAHYLQKQGKKVMLAACDIYRPAAIKQLQIVGEKAGVPVYEEGQKNPVNTVKNASTEARRKLIDVLIVDTAGRLHIDEVLMKELQDIKAAVKPQEILLTVDAMTGQDAVTVAEKFNADLDITGVIITKLDGDTRGGAALSIKAVTGKPIKFSGTGEKLGDFEPFYPDRIASRILGMGDVLTLIEKAQAAISEEEALALTQKMRKNAFTLDDYLEQLDKVKKMGNVKDMLGMIPGMSGKLKDVDVDMDSKNMLHTKAIIQSMTKKERNNPELIKASQKKRIADGSGTTVQEVNKLLKQFDQMRDMMRQMSSGKMKNMKFPF